MRTARVKLDRITDTWRVSCPVHGELARYRGKAFHTANRDALAHDAAHHAAAATRKEPTRKC
jgi:hypothetical protein